MSYLCLLSGIVLLASGAHFLVDGSKNLALKFNIRPIVIGLTIIALGTSFPELFVSLTSALRGSDDMALGNIIGSNIANIGLVFAIAAIIRPFKIEKRTLVFDFPFMLFVTLLFLVFSWGSLENGVLTGKLTGLEGAILIIVLIVYVYFSIKNASEANKVSKINSHGSKLFNLIFIILGCAGIVAGAYFMVKGGVKLAREFHVSEAVIGLSVIAVGTSLPELAASVAAAVKDQNEIGIGNIIGSNIFNFALVIGIVPLIRTLKVHILLSDYIIMVFYAVLLYVVFLLARKFGRIAGILFLISYFAYIIFRYI